MSELMNASARRNAIRWQLLTTVSALAILGSISVGTIAKADDESDKPVVWIELGGQLSRLEDSEQSFSPSLMTKRPSEFAPSPPFEKMPHYSIDGDSALSFQPGGIPIGFSRRRCAMAARSVIRMCGNIQIIRRLLRPRAGITTRNTHPPNNSLIRIRTAASITSSWIFRWARMSGSACSGPPRHPF